MRDKLTSRMQRPKKGTLCQSIRQSAALLWKSTPHSVPHPKPSHSSNIGSSILPAPKRFLRESQEYRNPTGEANWLSKLTQELPPPSGCLSTTRETSALEREIREPDWMSPVTRSLAARYRFKVLSL